MNVIKDAFTQSGKTNLYVNIRLDESRAPKGLPAYTMHLPSPFSHLSQTEDLNKAWFEIAQSIEDILIRKIEASQED